MSDETPVERRLRNLVDDHLLFNGHADLYVACADIRLAREALQLLRWRADTAYLVDLASPQTWEERVAAVLAKARET